MPSYIVEIVTEGPQGATGPASSWGSIPGTLSNQADLQAALDAKQSVYGVVVSDYGAVGDGVTDDAAALTAALAGETYIMGVVGAVYRCNSAVVIPSNRTIENLHIRRGFDGSFVLLTENGTTTLDAENITIRNLTIDDDGTTATRGGGLLLSGDNMVLDGYQNFCAAPYDATNGANAAYITGKDITLSRVTIDNRASGLHADGLHFGYAENLTLTDFHIQCGDDGLAFHPSPVTFPWSGRNLPSKNINVVGGFVSSDLSNGIRIGAWSTATAGVAAPTNAAKQDLNISGVTIGQCGTQCLELFDDRPTGEVASGVINTNISIQAICQEQTGSVRIVNIKGNPDIDNVANIAQHNWGVVSLDIQGATIDTTDGGVIRAGGIDRLTVSGELRAENASTHALTQCVFSQIGTVILHDLVTKSRTTGSFMRAKWTDRFDTNNWQHVADGTSEFQTLLLQLTTDSAIGLYMRGGRITETARAINLSGTGRLSAYVVEGTEIKATIAIVTSSTFSSVTWEAGAICVVNPLGGYVTTVANLPATSAPLVKGARAFVTDANATTFMSTVAAGGANNVPVVFNGTNWVIG